MTSSKLNNDLEERMMHFGVAIIRYVIPSKTALLFSVIDQVIRSATSIGANCSEAQNASSKSDFKNKVFISKKECEELVYSLQAITTKLYRKAPSI